MPGVNAEQYCSPQSESPSHNGREGRERKARLSLAGERRRPWEPFEQLMEVVGEHPDKLRHKQHESAA
jgi:hypothetical protein